MDDTQQSEGTVVAKGNHVVPEGVAVEELKNYDGEKQLERECPPAVKALLEKKGLLEIYDKMVNGVVKERSTRTMLGKWKDSEFFAVIDLFQEEFSQQGVKVALCKRKSGCGAYRWIEFIDVDEAGDYVPQYDVSNYSGQTIKTCYTTLEFPNGVAVEKLKNCGGRKRLKEKIPIFVEELLNKKKLMYEYNAFVDDCVEACKGSWNTEKLQAIAKAHDYKFEAKGVAIFISHKQEWISNGQYGGYWKKYRWVEFVDREEQPNFYPQRHADSKQEKDNCVIS